MNFKALTALGALVAASSAFAVTVTNTSTPWAGASELVLGFGSSLSTQNLEIALGTAASFSALADGQVHEIARLNAADLVTVFGTNWQNSSVNWGIAGFAGSAINNTAWMSQERTDAQIQSGEELTPYARWSSAIGNTVGGKIKGVQMGLAGVAANGSNGYTAIVETSWGPSWTTQGGQGEIGKAFSSTVDKPLFNNDLGMFATASYASGVSVSDLFQINSGSGASTYVGTFAITGDGQLLFSKDASLFAIPEPSTYAMILAGLTLGVVAYRRRTAKQV